MKNNITCPSCGSDKTSLRKEEHQQQLTLGPVFSYYENIFHCDACGEEGDFSGEGSTSFSLAEKEAQKILVKGLIDEIVANNFSMAYLERAFELPVRTSGRWKSGDFSALTVTFLRTVFTFPWIAEVAERRFNPIAAKQILLREAAKIFTGIIEADPNSSLKLQFSSGDSGSVINAEFIRRSSEFKPTITIGDQSDSLTCGAIA